MSLGKRHSATELLEIFPDERVLHCSKGGGRTYRCNNTLKTASAVCQPVNWNQKQVYNERAVSQGDVYLNKQALSILHDDDEEDEIDSGCSSPIPLHVANKNLSSTSRKKILEENPLGDEQYLTQLGFTAQRHFQWDDEYISTKTPIERALRYFIENNLITDCQVLIGDQVAYNCHRIVLQSFSNFFDAKSDEAVVVLPPEKVSCDAFESIYKWILADVDESCKIIERDTILEILVAARFLQVTELEEQIVDIINEESLFCESTAYVLYTIGKGFGLTDIQEVMLPRIRSFFLHLVSTRDFLELDESSVCSILSSNEIMVHNELEVFMSAVRWLRYQWPLRRDSAYTVLSTVRFGLIPAVSLVAIRRKTFSPEFNDILSADPQVSTLLDDGVAYTLTKHLCGSEGTLEMSLKREGLKVPQNRNWITPNQPCESYQDFLRELEIYREQIVKCSNAPRRRLIRGSSTTPRFKLLPKLSSDPGDGDNSKMRRHEPLADEFSLAELGFAVERTLDWDEFGIRCKKTCLYVALRSRLSEYINTDCSVSIGGIQYNTHRLLLNAYSKFFNSAPMIPCIDLPESEVTCSAFETIYKWMLSDAEVAHTVLRKDALLEVYMAARYLQISEVENLCYSIVQNKFFFKEGSAYVLYIIAKGLKFRDIMDMMIPRICTFFMTLVSSRDFLELDVDDICAILSSNYIVVNSEMEVFFSAVRWLRSDWINKGHYVYNVMSCVRFGYIPALQLVEIKCNEDLKEIVSEAEVTKLIDHGLAYSVIKSKYYDNKDLYMRTLSENYIMEPVPRNWSDEGAENVESYGKFLRFLQEKRKDFIKESRNEMYSSAKERVFGDVDVTKDRLSRKSSKNIREWRDPRVPVAGREMRNLTTDPYPQPTYSIPTERSEDYSYGTDQFKNTNQRQLKEMYQQARAAEQKIKPNCRGINAQKSQSSMQKKILPPTAKAVEATRCPSKTLSTAFTERNRGNASIAGDGSVCNEGDNFICNAQPEGGQAFLMSSDYESILVFGGIDPCSLGIGENDGKLIYRYCEERSFWEVVGAMPEARCYHAAILSGDRVFVIGGTDPRIKDQDGRSVTVNSVWSLDIHTKNWYRERNLPTARKCVGAVENAGRVYVIGGMDNTGKVLDTVERYNQKTKKWEVGPPLRTPRYAHCVAFFKNSIWVAGGRTSSGDTATVERLSLTGHEWEIMPPLRAPRSYAAMIAIGKCLYILGGVQLNYDDYSVNSLSEVDVCEAGEWKLRFTLSTPRHLHDVCALGNKIITIGGASTAFTKPPTEVESYCCKRRTKLRGIRPLPKAMSGHKAVTIPKDI